MNNHQFLYYGLTAYADDPVWKEQHIIFNCRYAMGRCFNPNIHVRDCSYTCRIYISYSEKNKIVQNKDMWVSTRLQSDNKRVYTLANLLFNNEIDYEKLKTL